MTFSNETTNSSLQMGGVGGFGRKAKKTNNLFVALLFLAPALASLIALRIVPAGVSLASSFNKTDVFTLEQSFVGMQNYVDLLANPEFLNTLNVTLVFSLLINPLQIAVATLLALLFTRKFPLRGLFRSLVIFPVAVPPAVSAVVWSAIYRPDGLANALLKQFGLSEQEWITSSNLSLFSVMILLSWIGCGYWMLFLIAGINDIPSEIYEASKIDGAGFLRQTFSITLPLLKRPLTFVLVADTVSNFLVFAPVSILTNGGPEGSTSLLMFDIFTRAYSYGDTGKASAAVFVLVVIMLFAVTMQFTLLRSRD